MRKGLPYRARAALLPLLLLASGSWAAGPAISIRELAPHRVDGVAQSTSALAVNRSGDIAGEWGQVFLWGRGGALSASGSLGAGWASFAGLNDLGQVVGLSGVDDQGTAHAFLWSAGRPLFDLGRRLPPESFPAALNDRGEVVGRVDVRGEVVQRGFFWSATTGFVDVGAPGRDAALVSLNDAGVALGNGQRAQGTPSLALLPFTWTLAGGIKELQVPDGYQAWGTKINERGEVIGGVAAPGGGEIHAAFWDARGRFRDLGTLGGAYSVANDLNDNGQVVGMSDTSRAPGANEAHAFLWSEAAGMKDLGTLGGTYSTANAVNNLGEVVGWSGLDRTPGSMRYDAFYWDGRSMIGLGNLGGRSEALDVNDAGLIVGWSELAPDEFGWAGVRAVAWQVPRGKPSCRCDGFSELARLVGEWGKRGKALATLTRSLLAKIDNGRRKCLEGRNNAAANELAALANEVRAAARAGRVAAAAADDLAARAAALRATLTAAGPR